jgi:hypothetical protein
MGEMHQLRGFIGRITKYMTLVTGSNLLSLLDKVPMNSWDNIRALLFNVNYKFAVTNIETYTVRNETDLLRNDRQKMSLHYSA